MPDYTTDTKTPNIGQENNDIVPIFIENTQGLWVRKNKKADELEIWYDGNLFASWKDADNIEGRLTAMCRECVGIGIYEAKRQFKEFLGIN